VAQGPTCGWQCLDLLTYMEKWRGIPTGATSTSTSTATSVGATSDSSAATAFKFGSRDGTDLLAVYHTLTLQEQEREQDRHRSPVAASQGLPSASASPEHSDVGASRTVVRGAAAAATAASVYPTHLDVTLLDAGVKSGTLFRGILNVNRHRPNMVRSNRSPVVDAHMCCCGGAVRRVQLFEMSLVHVIGCLASRLRWSCKVPRVGLVSHTASSLTAMRRATEHFMGTTSLSC
jgi:hypothetical protein